MSIIDDLEKPAPPKGKFWDALAALKAKDEEGYQAYTAAIFAPHPIEQGKYEYRPVHLQEVLTKHTKIGFGPSRISEVRKEYTTKEELPV